MNVVVVTAVEAEREAVLRALGEHQPHRVRVVAVGVGPAEAAAGASAELAGATVDLVLSAGIGGGFAPAAAGEIAVASASVFADLGSESADGFLPASDLGLGAAGYPVEPKLAVELADRTGGHLGTILTVATVTGTSRSAAELNRRFPDAVAEGMEGAGVAAAARRHGVPFAEIRAISNVVGPRDRASWQIAPALDALGRAVTAALADEPSGPVRPIENEEPA